MSSDNLDTRTRILKSTWKLLESGSGRSVRMSDIAKAVGISRQAVYLHFPKRVDLLVATTRYLDDALDADAKLAKSRLAQSGVERLDAYIEAWGNYIPEIYGVAKALLAMKDTDEEANIAWNGRMQAMREGCEAAIGQLTRDQALSDIFDESQAVDFLWTLLSVRNWEQLTKECNWSQSRYIEKTQMVARKVLVRPNR